MKLVTFNIRCDFGQDGKNNFCNRKPLILKKLKEENPDIICFQEVLPHVAVWLRENLSDYYVIGCGRSTTLEDEQVTIAYRKEKFNLMKMDTYWLSETPFVPGSRYENQSECPRVCTEVVLEDMENRKVFRLINTHLDYLGAEARRLGLVQILEKVEKETFFPHIPIILTGDFNVEPDGKELKVMQEYPGYVNVTEGIGITYHGYGGQEPPECIDYIYCRGAVKAAGVEKWTDEQDGVYLSDHYPVCALLELAE